VHEVEQLLKATQITAPDENQRVLPDVVVENKRLGHALAVAKALQELNNAAKSITNSEKKAPRGAFSRAYDDIRNSQNAG
jgi:hypothetical protein